MAEVAVHSAANGFLYTMDRLNGATVNAKPYISNINWTKGLNQKTGQPLDYDVNKDIQTYSGIANQNPGQPTRKACPAHTGSSNFWPSSYNPKTKLIYIPALSNCEEITIDTARHSDQAGWNGGTFRTSERYESVLTAVDPLIGEVKMSVTLPYPNLAGSLATAGSLVFVALLDGTVAAFDDTTLAEVWRFSKHRALRDHERYRFAAGQGAGSSFSLSLRS